jgi:hypothetical protein
MIRDRIKLLITLVLFTVVLAAVWSSSRVEARALSGRGASSNLGTMRPGVAPASGDPDIGQGVVGPPAPGVKSLRESPGSGIAKGQTFGEWVLWTGRIWATLYLRAVR